MNNFFSELKRRNVLRPTAAYAVVAWIVVQVATATFPPLGLPEWALTMVIVLTIVGFPITVLTSWFYEWTPRGFQTQSEADAKGYTKKQSFGRLFDFVVIALLALAVSWLVYRQEFQGTIISEASIAVLPFADLSPGGDQEYFSDGISEELLHVLAKYQGLRVTARTSSFQFKGDSRDVNEIAKKLNVAYVLEGSVRKSGNRVRISVQLIEASSGFRLWSETYDRELVDIFAIQDEISKAIGDALSDKLALAGDGAAPAVSQTTSPEAYTEYLLGRHLMNQRTRDTIEEALVHFEKAIELDENYAPPYANLAIAYGLLTARNYGEYSMPEAYALAKPFADRAMALDPDLAETHGAKSWMDLLNNFFSSDLKDLNKALELNPSYMDARIWKGTRLFYSHQYKEAWDFMAESVKLDPLNIIVNAHYLESLINSGDFDESKEVAGRIYSIHTGWGHDAYGYLAFTTGDLPGAMEHYLEGLKDYSDHTELVRRTYNRLAEVGLVEEALRFPGLSWFAKFTLYQAEGDWDSALDAVSTALKQAPENPRVLSKWADALYFTRDFDGALKAYEKAWAEKPNPEIQLRFQGGEQLIYYAFLLKNAGAEDEARAQFEFALRDLGKMEEAGYVHGEHGEYYQFKGMTLLYQGRLEDALDNFEKSFSAGNRNPFEFAGPLFDRVRDHPRFQALQAKYDEARQENREAILTIICAGDLPGIGWQPLETTCIE